MNFVMIGQAENRHSENVGAEDVTAHHATSTLESGNRCMFVSDFSTTPFLIKAETGLIVNCFDPAQYYDIYTSVKHWSFVTGK